MENKNWKFMALAMIGSIFGGLYTKSVTSCRMNTNAERKEEIGGYSLYKGDLHFTHDEINNRNELFVDRSALYVDNGCDGRIDTIVGAGVYTRDSRGDDKLKDVFDRADRDYKAYLKKLGLDPCEKREGK